MTISTASARRRWSAAAGLLGFGVAAAATAQTSTSVSVLEEIVVTAQKFEQKLSETPLSVTAISARTLEALGATPSSAKMLRTSAAHRAIACRTRRNSRARFPATMCSSSAAATRSSARPCGT